MKSPCYECEDRVLGCHSSCEKYADFRKIWDNISKNRAVSTKEHYDKIYYDQRAYKRVVNFRRRKK